MEAQQLPTGHFTGIFKTLETAFIFLLKNNASYGGRHFNAPTIDLDSDGSQQNYF